MPVAGGVEQGIASVVKRRKTLQEFYDARVVKKDGCWAWVGRKDSNGYGLVQLGRGLPRTGAHRVSWQLYYGEDPGKLFVCHRCDNPECTNPDHLFLGTQSDNLQDAKKKGRLSSPGHAWRGKRTHCQRGHPFDLANTKVHKGVRLCRKCRAENQIEYKNRKQTIAIRNG